MIQKTHYWIIVSKRGNPISINGQLPIFWYKAIAVKEAEKWTDSKVVKCRIEIDL